MPKKPGFNLVQDWPQAQINASIAKFAKQNIETQILVFNYIGQTFINEARDGGNYKDRTGNLRSSIGYAVINNGNIENSKFYGEQKGTSSAMTLINEVMNTQGIELIVTAGMEYAKYVEAKGYNVLSLFAPEKSELARDFKIFLSKL